MKKLEEKYGNSNEEKISSEIEEDLKTLESRTREERQFYLPEILCRKHLRLEILMLTVSIHIDIDME